MTQQVEATIQYLAPCVGKPIFHGRRQDLDHLPLEPRRVFIEDLRPDCTVPTLDREGFALLRQPSAVKNFFDPVAVREVYLRELEDCVQRLTGAVKTVALPGGVIRRSERSAGFGQPGTTVVGRFAHCDYSANPAGSRYWVESLLPPDEARERLTRRFAIYNLWRVLSHPPQDVPLALCDARSVGPSDAVATDCVNDPPDGPEWRFENTSFRHRASHRWCYFSRMTRDELLIFKGFESDPHRAGGIAHAAFDDPACPAGAPARESIDQRVIAFF